MLTCSFFRYVARLRLSTAVSLFFILSSFLFFQDLSALRNRYYEDESNVLIREVRDSVDEMRHEVNNHETEIRTHDEKLNNFETIIEGLRDQITEYGQAYKEQLKGNAANFESKIAALESLSKGLVSDLRQFKAHANEVSAALGQYKQKVVDLEGIIEQQNQNITHLQTALRSLTEVLQAKEGKGPSKEGQPLLSSENGFYRVKAGDSLEKIARLHQTTVSVIKSLNGLSQDRIVVGQLLKVPDNPS